MTDKADKTSRGEDRRGFLKMMTVGAVAGGAAAVTGAATAQAKPETPKDDTHYRETDHVKKYYELAKF